MTSMGIHHVAVAQNMTVSPLTNGRRSLTVGASGARSLALVIHSAPSAELTGGRIEPRFARLFLKLATEMGRPERGGVFVSLALSRQELADMTGTTIETCIRIMSRWNTGGIVRTDKDGFVLVNRPALEQLALERGTRA